MHSDSLSPVVDARYRLHYYDLHDIAHRVKIHNVTMQGLETTRPVLHFADSMQPLVLDSAQCNDMARITGSAVPTEWCGWEIMLWPTSNDDGIAKITLAGIDETLHEQEPNQGTLRLATLSIPWRALLMTLMVLIALYLLYRVDAVSALLQQVQSILP